MIRIHLVREHIVAPASAGSRPASRGEGRGRRAAAGAVLAAATMVVTGMPALADGTVNATVNVAPPAVKSVTVTLPPGQSSVTFDTCAGGNSTATQLGFPNGICNAPAYTVTNGNTAAEIDVTGANATPSSQNTALPWTLCARFSNDQHAAPACSGGLNPGQDQYAEQVATSGTVYTELSNVAQCDRNFTAGGACAQSSGGASHTEGLGLDGPSASSDASSSFSTTVTYTAI